MQFSEKHMIQAQENSEKPHFGLKFGLPIFFSKIWLCQSLDNMVSYQQISEKANDRILRKFSAGQTDGLE